MIRSAAAVALLVATLACDDGATSTPTAPTAPATAQVAGRWTGTLSASTSAYRGGGCWGDALRAADQLLSLNLTVTIEQDGTQLAGRSVSAESGNSCTLSGTVTGNSVDAGLGSCNVDVVHYGVVPGCGSEGWSGRTTAGTYIATVTGSTMRGTLTETNSVWAGTQRHTATVSGSLTLQKAN